MRKTIRTLEFSRGRKLLFLAALALFAALGLAAGLQFELVEAVMPYPRGLGLFTTCNCNDVAEWPQLTAHLDAAPPLVLAASIAGGVADCYPDDATGTFCIGDGIGDNHNDLLPSTPGTHHALLDGPITNANGGKGTSHFHVEWDISSLAVVESAEVLLHWYRGSIDSVDTFFYTVTVDGNGTLEDSDFQSPAVWLPGVVLPVNAGDPGDYGTFKFDVTSQLQDALDSGYSFFSIQGRVAEKRPVPIDIKPGACPNPLNTKSKGVLPVAVLGTEGFDVTTIDPATIQLTREGYDGVSPLRWSYEDVATPFEGELCECHDLNGDGYLDLTLKFKTQEVIATLELVGEAGNTIPLPLLLTGNLKDGAAGPPIEGSDCVRVL